MKDIHWPLVWACIAMALVIGYLFAAPFPAAYGRDLGQWQSGDPEIREWYRSIKQPDTGTSCCGEADSYWCSETSKGNQVQCIISDDRDDKALKRNHVPNGTVIDIPPNKINKDPNPTGHAVVFLSSAGFVWCFVGISGS